MPAAEWAADAKERDLEKVALQHIKAEAKAAERAQRTEVCSSTPSRPVAQLRRDSPMAIPRVMSEGLHAQKNLSLNSSVSV